MSGIYLICMYCWGDESTWPYTYPMIGGREDIHSFYFLVNYGPEGISVFENMIAYQKYLFTC